MGMEDLMKNRIDERIRSRQSLSPLAVMAPTDNMSMTTELLKPILDLQSLSQTLLISLSTSHPSKPPPPPPAPDAFLAADAELVQAVHKAFIHQKKQRRIERLKEEVLELEEQWRNVCQELETDRKSLQASIKEGERRRQSIKEAKEGSIPYPELLAYAHALSSFTSAPPNMTDSSLGQPPSEMIFPPFPNDQTMRRGHLNAEAPLGLPGETHSVGRAATLSPNMPDRAQVAGSYRHDPAPQNSQVFDFDLDLNPDL